MKTESIWMRSRPLRQRALRKSAEFDVVVVGGGITGLTAAFLLKQAGKRVCVLERYQLGAIDTGHTTAHLTCATDLRISELVKKFGKKAASRTWEAGSVAIDQIESIVTEHAIDCDFRRVPGFLHLAADGKTSDAKSLKSDAELAREFGFPAAYVEATPHFGTPGMRLANQAKFHPLKYLAALAELVQGDGCQIYGGSEVTEFNDDPRGVVVNGCQVRGDYLIIATHVPLMGNAGTVGATLFQTKIFPYTSYAIGATAPRGVVPEALYWDTHDPYYYLRVERGEKHDYLIFGGEDHKTGQAADTDECFARLIVRLLETVPQATVDRRWSGQVVETNDGLPYIGESAKNQFVGTGYSGNGMTLGTLAGMMARDAVLERENPWQELFALNRKKIRGGVWDFLKENVDFPYYFIKDRLASAEGDSTRDVKRGEGKILKIDGERVACSRDDNGKLTSLSPYCTHMGCIVRWNGAERTWDCPCHGSRFAPDGKVLGGPAEMPLERPEKKPAKPKS